MGGFHFTDRLWPHFGELVVAKNGRYDRAIASGFGLEEFHRVLVLGRNFEWAPI